MCNTNDGRMTNNLISSSEACALLASPRRPGQSIDRSTLSRWVKSGRLSPVMRLPGESGAMLFRRTDVEALARTFVAA